MLTMRLKAIPFAIMVMDHLNRNSLMKTLNILLGLEILCLNHYHKWLQMLVRLPTLLLVIVDHLLQDLFQESNVSVLFSRETNNTFYYINITYVFIKSKFDFTTLFYIIFAEEENRWQNNRPQVNRNRNANRGRRQSRPVAAVETNPALAALTLPPKERPDAKHHLKVINFLFYQNHIFFPLFFQNFIIFYRFLTGWGSANQIQKILK